MTNGVLSSDPGRAALSSQPNLEGAKRATRLAFFIAGFGLSCWAPLVPYAKVRLHAGDAQLGTILLFLGVGSGIGMPVAGSLTGRLGSRMVILAGSLGIAASLPLLALVTSATKLSAALILFGASIGAVDVAANVHGTEVQARAGRPLMSGFHGLYSVGGLLGAGAVTLALSSGMAIGLAVAGAPGPAISAVSTLGYLGVFVGPAAIGHFAAATSLPLAFGGMAVLMIVVVAMSSPVLSGPVEPTYEVTHLREIVARLGLSSAKAGPNLVNTVVRTRSRPSSV